ncbi:MAG TPA: hypothetical protein VJP79_03085 [Nitrososphaera sp.]|nr:hypothetical protein [Nitrososphaera sp.]
MLRAIVLAGAIAAALAVYFVMSLFVLPQYYQSQNRQVMPEAVVSGVSLSSRQIALGQTLSITVAGKNAGEPADMQIVSVGFPNLTASSEIDVLRHDFRQTPLRIDRGDPVGSGYGATQVSAQYPSIEASSRPWESGVTYAIDLQVKPQTEGNFVIFVKSVAFPHSSDRAHYPRDGPVDYQQEFVDSYSVQVTTKS